jgi:hypothetical protein
MDRRSWYFDESLVDGEFRESASSVHETPSKLVDVSGFPDLLPRFESVAAVLLIAIHPNLADVVGLLLPLFMAHRVSLLRGAVQTVPWHTGQVRQNGRKVRQLGKVPCVFAELR